MSSDKKKIAKLLRQAKKALKVPKTPTQKKAYVERQAKKMARSQTAPEKAMCKILKSLKVEFRPQEIIHGKIFDFFIPGSNLIVEVDGDYWHGYGKEHSELNEVQKRSVRNDSEKDVIAKGLGYDIVRFWEHDIMDNPEIVKEGILKKIS
jgi:very-short-patch-repair endonuclease